MLYRTEFQDPNGNPQISGCRELLIFMYENYNEPYIGEATFQGDFMEFSGMGVNPCSKVIVSPKFPRTVFFIEDADEDSFNIHIIVGEGCMDELPTATLPKYVKNELIENIAGRY